MSEGKVWIRFIVVVKDKGELRVSLILEVFVDFQIEDGLDFRWV